MGGDRVPGGLHYLDCGLVMHTLISADDLFYLRAAAAIWLSQNPASLNSDKVRAALLNTNPPTEEQPCIR